MADYYASIIVLSKADLDELNRGGSLCDVVKNR